MSIKPTQIHNILNHKRDDFTRFDGRVSKALTQYERAWQTLSQTPIETLWEWSLGQEGSVGARPLEDFEDTHTGVRRCGLTWGNREQSMVWVKQQLQGVTTFAVDGSQIFPSKDVSIPIALVQIGWFENPHSDQHPYCKDIDLDVMTPADLQVRDSSQPVDRLVNVRRFQMETERLVQYIQQVANKRRTLVFFDGSLVATFAEALDDSLGNVYVNCLLKLLRASEEHQVPLVGYVDTSYAHDLTTLLATFLEIEGPATVHDAQLLNRDMRWGDCTPVFRCDRSGILSDYQEQQDRIVFTYLKAHQGYPARLEMPLWMHETGLVEQVMNWVRAEIVVGSGYPYAIETADQTAVLQSKDRQVFFRVLQEWADQQDDLNLRLSRKMVSKVMRR
ncbi:MAG: DNA double-strand break repair nuclease NurA [Cyanobacteria bacterium J06632_22]